MANKILSIAVAPDRAEHRRVARCTPHGVFLQAARLSAPGFALTPPGRQRSRQLLCLRSAGHRCAPRIRPCYGQARRAAAREDAASMRHGPIDALGVILVSVGVGKPIKPSLWPGLYTGLLRLYRCIGPLLCRNSQTLYGDGNDAPGTMTPSTIVAARTLTHLSTISVPPVAPLIS